MEIQNLLEQVNRLKNELDAMRPIAPEQEQRIMQKLRLEWTYHSNSLEGNTLSFGETKALLLHGITAHGKPLRDYLEVQGHHKALDFLQAIVRKKEPLTEAIIRELHKMILVESYAVDAMTGDGRSTKRTIQPGQYKQMPNHVRTSTGETHYYASPEETPAMMGDLVAWYRRELEKGELHPLILATTFHYEFVKIHPFDDGNGRMARILMNLTLMQLGFVPIIIRTETKNEYLLALEKADDNDLSDFIHLVGKALVDSLQLYLRGAKGESIEEPSDLDKKIAILQQKIKAKKAAKGPEKSSSSTATFYAASIEPFFSHLLLQLNKFDHLFTNTTLEIHYWTQQSGRLAGNDWKIAKQYLSDILAQQNDITRLSFDKKWHNFTLDQGFSTRFELYIDLNQFSFTFKYKIASVPKFTEINGQYDMALSITDIEELIKPITDKFLEVIEQQTSS